MSSKYVLPSTFTVDAKNLYTIFRCLLGPSHMIVELQAIRDMDDTPIKKLGDELLPQIVEATKRAKEGEDPGVEPKCPRCHGNGVESHPKAKLVVCPECGGDGR